MQRLFSFIFGFVILAWSSVAASAAQGEYAVPDGSYLNSCRNAQVAGYNYGEKGLLTAQCRDGRGRYVNAQLQYSNCRGDIFNNNGQLGCDTGKSGRQVPFGSYLNSCRNAQVKGRTLSAECRTKNGAYHLAQIAYRYCRGDISNNNGQLNCRTQGDGDWYAEEGRITLFDRNDYRGKSVTLDRNYPNLDGLFNDAASSVRVYDGVWQACKDKNFQGGCILIDRNWRSLPQGTDNNISSIRRVQ
ncbi:MAG: hypothetical protein H7Z40_13945 [Phycisphaerae bacterium]|nr:hypothetical protein [Gemmatimonadaceae bacterium]